MKLYIFGQSFDCTGGVLERKCISGVHRFRALEALFEQVGDRFGPGLEEIDLELFFFRADRFETRLLPPPACEQVKGYRESVKIPKRIFWRSKKRLSLSANASLVSAEDFFWGGFSDPSGERRLYRRDLSASLVQFIADEMHQCRKKFTPEDSFRFSDFMAWLETLSDQLPEDSAAAQPLARWLDERRRDEYSKLSEWDRLDVDWESFHPRARDILPDPCLWSQTDDLSPNGNDMGFDTLAYVQEHKGVIAHQPDGAREVFGQFWDSFGYRSPGEHADFKDTHYEEFRRYTIGFAFAHIKTFAMCPDWLSDLALSLIDGYEAFVLKCSADQPDDPEFGALAQDESFVSLNKAMRKALNDLKG